MIKVSEIQSTEHTHTNPRLKEMPGMSAMQQEGLLHKVTSASMGGNRYLIKLEPADPDKVKGHVAYVEDTWLFVDKLTAESFPIALGKRAKITFEWVD